MEGWLRNSTTIQHLWRKNGNEEKGSALSRSGSRTDDLWHLNLLHILVFCLTPSWHCAVMMNPVWEAAGVQLSWFRIWGMTVCNLHKFPSLDWEWMMEQPIRSAIGFRVGAPLWQPHQCPHCVTNLIQSMKTVTKQHCEQYQPPHPHSCKSPFSTLVSRLHRSTGRALIDNHTWFPGNSESSIECHKHGHILPVALPESRTGKSCLCTTCRRRRLNQEVCLPGQHAWIPTSFSGDKCHLLYVGRKSELS